ncbi:hypothetical protein FOZ76_08430 [Verticiella sediminum]|uniref:Uncharacterized protein n=1 Tax=Verticiella sediminum TaxID=1247510 RepID=A0A556AVA1_9BURK|nr:hypothetical protein [Verticiella sediminum]TSH96840.1 hypothetical protein FOZ76_08430 [Verticiella sediminum]
MALELARALAATERDDNLHMARLLLLMAAHAGDKNRPVEGLTKLAKLDFLLRYPNCLERALTAAGKKPEKAGVLEFERTTIESKMVRFRYGPWDHRYRRWVALMAAQNLIAVDVKGKTVQLWPTPEGYALAQTLSDQESLEGLAIRAKLVAKNFGNRSGTDLKNFVYDTFPELTSMKWGEEISI